MGAAGLKKLPKRRVFGFESGREPACFAFLTRKQRKNHGNKPFLGENAMKTAVNVGWDWVWTRDGVEITHHGVKLAEIVTNRPVAVGFTVVGWCKRHNPDSIHVFGSHVGTQTVRLYREKSLLFEANL